MTEIPLSVAEWSVAEWSVAELHARSRADATQLEMSTHAIIQPTTAFPAERLGKFCGMLIPLERFKCAALTSIVLVIDDVGYRAYPTTTTVIMEDGTNAVEFIVAPMPVQVEA